MKNKEHAKISLERYDEFLAQKELLDSDYFKEVHATIQNGNWCETKVFKVALTKDTALEIIKKSLEDDINNLRHDIWRRYVILEKYLNLPWYKRIFKSTKDLKQQLNIKT